MEGHHGEASRKPEQVSVTLISLAMTFLQYHDESCVESDQLPTNTYIIRYTVIATYRYTYRNARTPIPLLLIATHF